MDSGLTHRSCRHPRAAVHSPRGLQPRAARACGKAQVVRRMQRVIQRTSLAVAVGFGLTLALAWLPVFWNPGGWSFSSIDERSWRFTPPPSWPTVCTRCFVESNWASTTRIAVAQNDTNAEFVEITITVGWPFRGLGCVVTWQNPPPPGTVQEPPELWRGMAVSPSLVEHGSFVRPVLPIQPLWSGLIANVALWSAAAWIGISAIGPIKGHVRRLRHRCPDCGQQLLNPQQRCSECGNPGSTA
jgi:hypothetical protein